MKEEKKLAVPGKTVYLNEGEKFEDVKVPDLEKDKVEVIKAEENLNKPKVEEKQSKDIIKDQIEFTEKLLKKSKEEKEVMKKVEISEGADLLPKLENFEKEVEVNLFEDLETFEKESEEMLTLDEDIEEEIKAKVVDISKYNLVNKTEIDKEKDLRTALYGSKAAFQIVAAKSGYIAKMLPLVYRDSRDITEQRVSRYEYKKSVFRVVWEKIYESSVGKFSFDDWIKNTCIEDIDTFYYGIYASTFPNEGAFRYKCPACSAEKEYKISHNNLIKTTDKESMKKLIEDVSKGVNNRETMKQFSLIGKNQAIELTESKIVVELKTPTIFDSLEILRTIPEKMIDKDEYAVTDMLYIERMLIPSKDNNGYFEELNKPAMLRIIENLPMGDASELRTAVSDRVEENRISYSIKNIKCTECEYEVKEIPLVIEDILFRLIFRKSPR
jgi:hypothetical protein